MRICANLGVRDEVELIGPAIEHLLAIGVDQIVVTDLFSEDGTAERLGDYEGAPNIRLIRLRPDDPQLFDFAQRMLDFTLTELQPDWVLFLDADEFWIPRTGRIKDTAALRDADVLQVPRFNVPVSIDGVHRPPVLEPSRWGELALITAPARNPRRHLAQNPDAPWILGRIQPKTLARASNLGAVAMGGHSVESGSAGIRTPADLLIAHLPITTPARFARKVDNIRQTFERFGERFVGEQAWHWRRWLQCARDGKLDEEFQRQIFSREQMQALRKQGRIRTAAQYFAAHDGS